MCQIDELFNRADYQKIISKFSEKSKAAKLSLKEREIIALSYFQTQNFEKAREIFESAVKIEPTRALNHYHLGLCYLELDNTQEAVIALKKSIQTDPLLQKAYYALGNIYYEYNLQEEALQLWKEILVINPFTETAKEANERLTAYTG